MVKEIIKNKFKKEVDLFNRGDILITVADMNYYFYKNIFQNS